MTRFPSLPSSARDKLIGSALMVIGLALILKFGSVLLIGLPIFFTGLFIALGHGKKLPTRKIPDLIRWVAVAGFCTAVLVIIGMLVNTLYDRSPAYFILIPLVATIIVFQSLIAHNESDVYIVIIETIILAVIVRVSLLYLFDGFVAIDPWSQAVVVRYITMFGNFPPASVQLAGLQEEYSGYPGTQLASGLLSLFTGMDAHYAYPFFLDVSEVSSIMAVYLIARQLFGWRTGCIAMLWATMAPYDVTWGITPVPTALGFSLILVIVYVSYAARKQRALAILLPVLFLSILISNPLLPAIAIFLFLIFLVGYSIAFLVSGSRGRRPVSLFFVLLVLISTLAYFQYSAGGYVFNIILNRLNAGIGLGEVVQYEQTSVSVVSKIIGDLGEGIVYGLAAFEAYLIITKVRSRYQSKKMDKVGYSFSILLFFVLEQSLSITAQTLVLPFRWLAAIQSLISPLAGRGLLIVKRRWTVFLVLILAFSASFAFLNNDTAYSWDSPYNVTGTGFRWGLMQSEISSFGLIDRFAPSGRILTDVVLEVSVPWSFPAINGNRLSLPDETDVNGRFDANLYPVGLILVARYDVFVNKLYYTGVSTEGYVHIPGGVQGLTSQYNLVGNVGSTAVFMRPDVVPSVNPASTASTVQQASISVANPPESASGVLLNRSVTRSMVRAIQ